MALPYNKRTHMCGQLRAADVGKEVLLAGWVNSYRDHGGMVFIDLRDREGIAQIKFNPETDPKAHAVARTLRAEDCIVVRGDVVSRGENVNPKLPTGEIEVEGRAVDVLNKSDTPPIAIEDDIEASEELRLRHRYLDLRRPLMQRTFALRARIARIMRDHFAEAGFLEIETPFLGKSTPEGARDYLVPSRVQQGSFYALPQSPQLYKQLFMVAGFDRYAQIVRCFRDEDLRADRQPEFTQLDLEMSFVQAEDVMTVVEGCIARVFRECLDVDVTLPLPRMPYAQAVGRYGIDRPDPRFGMELIDVTDIVRGSEFGAFREAIAAGGVVKCLVAKGGEQLTRKITDGLAEEVRGIGGTGLPLVKASGAAEGVTFTTGVAKHVQEQRDAICAATGAEVGDAIFFMPGPQADVGKYLHHVRTRLIEIMQVSPSCAWDVRWIVDFPLLEWDQAEQRWFSLHHPFTAPRDEDLPLLESDPGKVRSKAYDLVVNGIELGGGSIRIHQRDVQRRMFKLLGIGDEEARVKFEYLLDALRFGAPPHGGIALGFDRVVMVVAGQPNLREVIAFPKTQRATCPLTGAPSEAADEQLAELGVELTPAVRAKRKAAPAPSSVHTGEHIHKHGK